MKQITQIPCSSIHAGQNDRTVFDPKCLQELADNIKAHGLIQPITVNLFAPDPSCCFGGDRLGAEAQFTIIAGERRFRACLLLGWETIPAIIVEITQAEASALMLAENVSRQELDPIDEANAYRIRIDKLGWSIDECATAAGTSSIRVQFRLKLLNLHLDIQHLIRSGNFQIGYARILSDANLDINRQMLAFKMFRDNPRPTPGWFRNIVNQYAEQQQQAGLFDTSSLLVMQEIPIDNKQADPASPDTTVPPVLGKTKLAILQNQIKFWNEAAVAWGNVGKPFKKHECEAAAFALYHATSLFS